MKKIILLVWAFLLVACSTQREEQVPLQSVSNEEQLAPLAQSRNNGAAVAADLNVKWSQTSRNCFNSETAPSFLCSGVVIRGTTYGDGYNVWDPSPGGVKNGFVAFSYMRQDSKFPALYGHANNGYIATPISELTAGQLRFQYLCFFPIDGATEWRSDNGCGQHSLHGAISRYCSSQGISNADQFVAHYMANTPVREQKQCSFDVRDTSTYQTAALFREGLLAMRRIPKNKVNDENELVVRVWNKQAPANMPIKSFFYTDASGLNQAKKNQNSYYSQTGGKIVPIVKLTINSSTWAALFSYSAADQVYP
ncbi:hypothetical protein [Pseudomonas lini]|uniref:Halovibrin HvnC n=1 Tax=Pseudomonas lini TaxID=163011 RepID=A0A1H1TM70_9PSED|nr:hypothetical protein [Pseudomonas lini]KAB0502068.1 hypothetical protein F7R14_20500 [Pseudomonas lini]SDS60679.1 hypothetical protein SAMN04490191_1844 [Pseudomonas lini]